MTVNYEHPFLVLLHDEIAYNQLFGNNFAHDPEKADEKL